jgi:serine/threonine-protein phosphatase 6 regulatory subunit 3
VLEVHANAARTLVDIILKCPPGQSNVLVSQLRQPLACRQLVAHMLSGSESSLLNTLPVVSTLIHRCERSAEVGDEPDAADGERPLPPILDEVLQALPRLLELLQRPVRASRIPTSYGQTLQPFGETRLMVVGLVLALLSTNRLPVVRVLSERRVLATVLDLFFEYKWNNMLHNLVLQLVRTALESPHVDAKLALVRDARFAERCAAVFESLEAEGKRARTFRPGYLGHLLKAAALLAECRDEALRPHLADNARWAAFMRGAYAREMAVQQTMIGDRKQG